MKQLLLLVFLVTRLTSSLAAQTNPANPSGASVFHVLTMTSDFAGTAAAIAATPPSDTILEYSPPAAQYARAKSYSLIRYRHFFISTLYGLLVLLVILRWQIGPAFRNLAERASSRRSFQLIIFAPLTLLTIAVLTLPTEMWDHSLERAFGLSVENWGPWFSDWVTGQIIALIVGTVLVGILYAVIRRSPRRWWLYFWLVLIPVLLIVFFLQPLVVEPLFFTFKPLRDAQPALVSEIQKVTHHGGIEIPAERMFVMNASSKETDLDAYVAGFGASKRVVVWDNTIAKATIPETLFVFGHEMGHYLLLHIPKGITIVAGILLPLLYLGFRLAHWILHRWGTQWGIRNLGDWASLPALLLLTSLLTFLATPMVNAVSRYFEHEADRYGIEVIHGVVPNANQAAAHYFEMSGEMNLSDPDPNWFIKAWFFDHPTRPERVHFVARYDPWSHGEEPIYVK